MCGGCVSPRYIMSLRFQSVLLIVSLAFFNSGYSLPVENGLELEFQKIIHEVDAKNLLSFYLPEIRKAITNNGMDPTELESFSEGILPLPGILEGNINFKNGWLQGLAQVRSAKQAVLTYANKRLVVDMVLNWADLQFTYEYDFRYLLLTRRGDVVGHFKDVDVRVVVTLDFLTYQVHFDILEFVKVGKLSLRLEGHLADPLFNAASKVVTTLFKNSAVRRIENRALTLTQAMFGKLNEEIPRPATQFLDILWDEEYLL